MVVSSLQLPNVELQEGRETHGHSAVFDPWDCVGILGNEPGVLTVDIDRDLVAKTRATVPVIGQHRDFYP